MSNRGVRRLLNRLERNGKGLVPSLWRDLGASDDLLSRASVGAPSDVVQGPKDLFRIRKSSNGLTELGLCALELLLITDALDAVCQTLLAVQSGRRDRA